MDDVDSSTRGLCAILSRDLVALERSLSFTYRRLVESCSSLEQIYFGKRRALKPNKLILEPLNFGDDIVRGSNCRKRTVFIPNLVGHIVCKFQINVDGLGPHFWSANSLKW